MSTAKNYLTSTLARDVMTLNVVTIRARQKMSIAAQELQDHHIAGVPVVSDEGICLGVLSREDIPETSQGNLDDSKVMSYMTSPAITVSKNHSLLDVAAIMRSSRIPRVPVVDDHGQVVGIFSALDIVD